jgi:hypothetical protein
MVVEFAVVPHLKLGDNRNCDAALNIKIICSGAMNRLPIIAAWFFVALVATDAIVFDGQSRRTVWQETQHQLNIMKFEVISLLRHTVH